MSAFDPDAFIAAAVEQTGLTDFGPDSYREGLEIFCASAENEALSLIHI